MERFNKEFVISTYCSPQPPKNYNGVDYPDKVTKEQYLLLKKCGVNLAMGHADVMNTDTEKYAFRALDICSEIGIGYLVKDFISYEYTGLGDRFKDYRKLSEQEKKDLDERFIASLKRYKDKPSFAGIIAMDEPGSAMFDGISHEKEIFEKICPDKIFFVNLFPYYIVPKYYQFGLEKVDEPTDKEYEPYVQDNIVRYEHYLGEFINKVDTDILCYDAYPFFDFANLHNIVHFVEWELQQAVSKACRDLNKTYWTCLQNGGLWFKNVRVPSFGEVQLNVSLALLYGAKGLVLYPGCFPNDCLENINEHSGIVDKYGEITEQYHYFGYAFMQLKAIQKHLINAELKGIIVSSGNYFGLLPSSDVVEKTDKEQGGGTTIFNGKLPHYANIEIQEFGEIQRVEATSQCLLGCFENSGKNVFLLVNNSPFAAADVKIYLDQEYDFEYIKGTVTYNSHGKTLEIYALPAGENALIRIIG